MQRPPKPALIMVVLVDRSFRTLSLPHRISWTDPGVTDHHNRLPEALVSRNWVWHMPHWGAPFSIRCFVQIACIPFRTFDPRINLDALDVLTTILLRCWEMQRIYTVWKRLSLHQAAQCTIDWIKFRGRSQSIAVWPVAYCYFELSICF